MKNLNTQVVSPARLVLLATRTTTFVIMSLLLLLGTDASAITYYSRQTGPWSVNSTWSTVGYGNATNTGTRPGPGDVVNIPPHVKHWHGAAKDSGLAHVAIEIDPQKGPATWMEPVAADVYNALK